VVDRLLASKQYGERWGRHWMDVWRYSDPFGLGEEYRYKPTATSGGGGTGSSNR